MFEKTCLVVHLVTFVTIYLFHAFCCSFIYNYCENMLTHHVKITHMLDSRTTVYIECGNRYPSSRNVRTIDVCLLLLVSQSHKYFTPNR